MTWIIVNAIFISQTTKKSLTFDRRDFYSKSEMSMNIKANVVNEPKHVVLPYSEEEKLLIAKWIKRQNKNRFTTVKTVVFQAVSLLAVLAVCILILGAAFHFANFNKTKQQLETENLIRQLESGKSVEMTVRVGGAE